jgi:hypothetical protein
MSDETVLNDYFDWVFSLMSAEDPQDPTTLPKLCNLVDLNPNINVKKTIEICTVKAPWDVSKINFYNSLLGKQIPFTLKNINNDPNQSIKLSYITMLSTPPPIPFFINIKDNFIQSLQVTSFDDNNKIPNPVFEIYPVKPSIGDTRIIFVSYKAKVNHPSTTITNSFDWYTLEPDIDLAWKTLFPVESRNSSPFVYFLNNSPKYINKCCTNTENNGSLGGLQNVCDYFSYRFDHYSKLSSPQCDSKMEEICKKEEYKDNTLCSCINRTNPKIMDKPLYNYLTDTLKIPSSCISGACDDSTSYVPSELRRQICPNTCTSLLNVNSNGYANVDIDGVNMVVECNQTNGNIYQQPATSSSYRIEDEDYPIQNGKWVLYLQLSIIAIVLILLIFL